MHLGMPPLPGFVSAIGTALSRHLTCGAVAGDGPMLVLACSPPVARLIGKGRGLCGPEPQCQSEEKTMSADVEWPGAGTREEIWIMDPATLRDVVLDRDAMEARLGDCTALERVWILSLLGREEDSLTEGLALLAASRDRLRPLLVLAQTYQRRYQWHHAAGLHEEALRLARTPATEALVRHQIGRRLFDEARYRDAAAEFEWACDLYRTAGRDRLAQLSRRCMNRARQVQAQAQDFDDQP